MNIRQQQIQLIDIQQTGFNAENLLRVILQRDKLLNGLMNWLHEANKKKILDDKHDQLYIRILKVCTVQYAYYQLLQGFNFIVPQNEYAGMCNHFYKIFITEDDYKEQIQQFQKTQTNQTKIIREDFEKRMKTLIKWKSKLMDDYELIKNEFNETSPDYLKFEKLKQQINKSQQVNFDIYQYYFTLFYQEEWFKQPLEDNPIELIRLLCLIKQFLRLDNLYPIEQYANQSITLLDINESEKRIEYYLQIIKQK